MIYLIPLIEKNKWYEVNKENTDVYEIETFGFSKCSNIITINSYNFFHYFYNEQEVREIEINKILDK